MKKLYINITKNIKKLMCLKNKIITKNKEKEFDKTIPI